MRIEFEWMSVERDSDDYIRVYDTYGEERLVYSLPVEVKFSHSVELSKEVKAELRELADEIGVCGCQVSCEARQNWLISTVKLLYSLELTALERERGGLESLPLVWNA